RSGAHVAARQGSAGQFPDDRAGPRRRQGRHDAPLGSEPVRRRGSRLGFREIRARAGGARRRRGGSPSQAIAPGGDNGLSASAPKTRPSHSFSPWARPSPERGRDACRRAYADRETGVLSDFVALSDVRSTSIVQSFSSATRAPMAAAIGASTTP